MIPEIYVRRSIGLTDGREMNSTVRKLCSTHGRDEKCIQNFGLVDDKAGTVNCSVTV